MVCAVTADHSGPEEGGGSLHPHLDHSGKLTGRFAAAGLTGPRSVEGKNTHGASNIIRVLLCSELCSTVDVWIKWLYCPSQTVNPCFLFSSASLTDGEERRKRSSLWPMGRRHRSYNVADITAASFLAGLQSLKLMFPMKFNLKDTEKIWRPHMGHLNASRASTRHSGTATLTLNPPLRPRDVRLKLPTDCI